MLPTPSFALTLSASRSSRATIVSSARIAANSRKQAFSSPAAHSLAALA